MIYLAFQATERPTMWTQADCEQHEADKDDHAMNHFIDFVWNIEKSAEEGLSQVSQSQHHSAINHQADRFTDSAAHIHFSGGKGHPKRHQQQNNVHERIEKLVAWNGMHE